MLRAACVGLAVAGVAAVRDEPGLSSMSIALEEEGISDIHVARHRDSGGRKANVSKANVNVLQYNLCWECMSAWDDGSGKYASKHCRPGQIGEEVPGTYTWKELGKELATPIRTPPKLRDPAGKQAIFDAKIFDRYATDCTWHVLHSLQQWHQATPFDFISMSELCSPGKDGKIVTGFQPQSDTNAEEYGYRQCSPLIFDLMSKLLPDLVPVVNAVTTRFGPVTQLTWYPSRLGNPLVVKTGMADLGRPITALLWASKKLMFINVHAIHFRKNLIVAKDCSATTEMCDYVKEKSGVEKTNGFTAGFTLPQLPTEKLRSLFAGFITSRIAASLPDLCSDASACKLPGWRIIAGGDFNDETGELFDLELFGVRVSLDNSKRKRTCCSDRDEYWLSTYDKPTSSFTGYTGGEKPAYSHTDETWQYLLQQCMYAGDCTGLTPAACQDVFAGGAPNAVITDNGAGAPRPSGGTSRYPFASDLILDSAPVQSFSFPTPYTQSADRAYSDHDPVVAVLQPLPS